MRKIAAFDRTAPAVAQIDMSDVRSGQRTRTGTDHVCGMWRQARMRKIAAFDRTAPAVAQIDMSDVRSGQSAGVLWSPRGWGRVAV